jgi:hypothetical protein
VDWGKLRETPLNAEQNDGVLTELLQLMHWNARFVETN